MSELPTTDQEGTYKGMKPAFYDEQLAESIKSVMDYLSGPRGQWAVNRLAARDHDLHRAVTVQHHNIPWHNLGLPGWTP